MKTIEFGRMCQPYNKEYYKLFGTVPCIDNYAATQEQFFDALKKAIKNMFTQSLSLEKEIENFVPKRATHNDGRMK